ncbi:hypothetical protein BDY21DRAFT_350976 [Lineolata rhizophorae]|uniref:Nucleoside-diphosphate-sugar epimerase n=1 Tax=Lineolata rhizophorae TaxID=578093 RepID=A0A6A6NTF8_9PEZI|nr:hypothetical protein BDY21DRAFT_350976 [Lineolata rhizophorae]
MTHLILTGATGLAGSAFLSHALSSPSISHVSILSRRPVPLATSHPNAAKATVHIHADFATYPDSLLGSLHGATACVWALGGSSVGMSEAEYVRMTRDYPVAAASAFAELNKPGTGESAARPFTFVYVSADDADQAGTSSALYRRVKGQAERDLLSLMDARPSLRVYNARAGAIIPDAGAWIADRPMMAREKYFYFPVAAPVLKKVYPNIISPTGKLAEALVKLAIGDGESLGKEDGKNGLFNGGRTVGNKYLREMVGLPN